MFNPDKKAVFYVDCLKGQVKGLSHPRLFVSSNHEVFFSHKAPLTVPKRMNQEQKLYQGAELLKILAHPDRLRIIILLAQQGPLNVSTMMDQLPLQQSLLSHHLIKMRDKGLLVSLRKGKKIYYSLSDPTLVDIPLLLLNRSSN